MTCDKKRQVRHSCLSHEHGPRSFMFWPVSFSRRILLSIEQIPLEVWVKLPNIVQKTSRIAKRRCPKWFSERRGKLRDPRQVITQQMTLPSGIARMSKTLQDGTPRVSLLSIGAIFFRSAKAVIPGARYDRSMLSVIRFFAVRVTPHHPSCHPFIVLNFFHATGRHGCVASPISSR